MINITAKDVSTLRAMTGAGLMDCKAALIAAQGNMETAKEVLRKKGLKLADKKAERDTNCGLVGIKITNQTDEFINVEMRTISCETDFVSKNSTFHEFAEKSFDVAAIDIDATEIISKMGENIKVKSVTEFLVKSEDSTTIVSTYIHGQAVDHFGSIVSMVAMEAKPDLTDDEVSKLNELAYSIAMHIAAMKPIAIDISKLDEDFVENEKRIFTEQATESGKPANIVEKMVEGKLQKRMREVCLVHQPLVTDNTSTIGEVLLKNNAIITSMARLAIGE